MRNKDAMLVNGQRKSPMIDTSQIRREIEAARESYAREHPEIARLLPMGNSVEYHIINALNFLADAVEESHCNLECGHCDLALADYEGEKVDTTWTDYPNTDTRITGGE